MQVEGNIHSWRYNFSTRPYSGRIGNIHLFDLRAPLSKLPDNQQALAELASTASRQGFRYLVILAGKLSWQLEIVRAYSVINSQTVGHCRVICLSDAALAGLDCQPHKRARELLGQECTTLVVNCHEGFDTNSVGAASGTLVGGGLLLMLVPPLAEWPANSGVVDETFAVHPFTGRDLPGRYIQRFIRLAKADPNVFILEQDAEPVALAGTGGGSRESRASRESGVSAWQQTLAALHSGNYSSPDQQQAVAAIVKVAQGRSRRPLVISSDRGRGKSAALGIAVAQLLQSKPGRIIVTAPQRAAVDAVFERARACLASESESGLQQEKNSLLYMPAGQPASRLQFFPPDQLLNEHCPAELLLVDEAASIPTAMLEGLLARYSPIVFCSTIHGYEGAGRGFALRFNQILDQQTAQWRRLHMLAPIRWAEGDPLEAFLFKGLLMNAEACELAAPESVCPQDCVIECLDRDQLLADEALLRQIFALLVIAHYQTSPNDLRHLLDGLNISVWVLRHGEQLLAAALVSDEGGFDRDLGDAIWRGERRPRGHLIAQSLCAHCGMQGAAELRGSRIMRVAVHPAVQRRGLGSRLISALIEDARQRGMDWIGSSFAASTGLLGFWRRLGMVPVRLGSSRDTSSGSHAAIVLASLSVVGDELLCSLLQRFVQQFPHQLSEHLQDLDAELVVALLAEGEFQLAQQEWLEVQAYSAAYRNYEMCSFALWRFACRYLSRLTETDKQSERYRRAIVLKVLQRRPWSDVADRLGLTGRKQLENCLRKAFVEILRSVKQ